MCLLCVYNSSTKVSTKVPTINSVLGDRMPDVATNEFAATYHFIIRSLRAHHNKILVKLRASPRDPNAVQKTKIHLLFGNLIKLVKNDAFSKKRNYKRKVFAVESYR